MLADAIGGRANEMAERLMLEFGSIDAVLASDDLSLSCVTGLSPNAASALKAAGRLVSLVLHARIGPRPSINNWQALCDYLRFNLANRKFEWACALYLDDHMNLLKDERFTTGSLREVVIQPRPFIRQALACGATGLILIHNHPSGNPEPSAQDIRFTRDVVQAGKMFEIVVHDHLIFGRDGHSSMRAMGLI